KLVAKAGRGGLFVALMLFVGIPLPGTGAWTGTLAASFLNMGIKSTALSVSLGVVIAAIIMSLASTGVFSIIGL
ncbi:MAG: small multi-drug export protein, partial [Oscillospiraceae bacterium]|nr:small multi-drug export protein [Oscillospiraceae bacterium]